MKNFYRQSHVLNKIIFAVILAAILIVAADVLFLGDITEGVFWTSYTVPKTMERVNAFLALMWVALLVGYFAFLKNSKFKNASRKVVVVTFIILVMTHNFTTEKFIKSPDPDDVVYDYYSENLIIEKMVSGAMHGEDKKGMMFLRNGIFGDINYIYERDGEGLTNANFNEGYAVGVAGAFALPNLEFTKQTLAKTAMVVFAGGTEYRITEIEENPDFIMVYTDCERILTTAEDGALRHIVLKDEYGKELVTQVTVDYNSQYGLHGQIVEAFYHYIHGEHTFEMMRAATAISMAVVASLICFLINKKYNTLMAVMFFVTFAFSPYVAVVAKNLYWLEFLWFVPVLVGLFCAVYTDNRKARILSYIAMFAAVLVKSLCGYEYMSTILIAAMTFLTTDMVCAFVEKDKEKFVLVFKTTVILSLAALAGFFAAIMIHSFSLGNGSIAEGLRMVYEEAVVKNTNGGAGAYDLPEHYTEAFKDPLWLVIKNYFYLSANVIYGISGRLFAVVAALPAAFAVYDFMFKGKTDVKAVVLYVVSVMATLSWVVLAQGHSMIHVKLNYVLWYFGFVQICLYIIIDRLIKFVRGKDKTA